MSVVYACESTEALISSTNRFPKRGYGRRMFGRSCLADQRQSSYVFVTGGYGYETVSAPMKDCRQNCNKGFGCSTSPKERRTPGNAVAV